MTSKERARAFLQKHLGQMVSMGMLEELSESFEDHRGGLNTSAGKIQQSSPPLRAVADIDEEVDDDAAE